ncbi:hypothetical protein E2C01_043302 [Portunus trituberculatus]|uniref:Uncharacterized protein n=1 Tax=Portunus trituberculatus TaxID=210409 RepID=A0A5B7FVY8_PORTR|nr:hypothetical protein [Portunus trituberculatus]
MYSPAFSLARSAFTLLSLVRSSGINYLNILDVVCCLVVDSKGKCGARSPFLLTGPTAPVCRDPYRWPPLPSLQLTLQTDLKVPASLSSAGACPHPGRVGSALMPPGTSR